MFNKFNNTFKKLKKRRKKTLRPAIETKISSSGMTEENLELLGLRLKMLAVDCGEHEKWRVFKKVPNYVYYANNLSYEIVKTHNIYERLTVSKFEHYSSILIFINCQNERCRRKSLCTIIKAIRCNKRIRNQLKLIWTTYRGYSHAFTPDILFDSMFKDFFIFKSKRLENTILFQDHFERKIQVLLHLLTSAPFTTAQEIQQILKCQYLLIQLKSTVDLYFYGVNPALAIIINNYYFTNSEIELDPREGSENDVLDLISTFIETRTPYIVINDISRSQLLRWREYLCRKDMESLQNLYFVTMTHGSSNNIIYTNDGEIDFIEDIVRPIQENVTLRTTNVTFINVHCRGDVLADCVELDYYDNIPFTRIENLRTNITILFSVPETTISPRYPTKGTPVIKSFNRIYCNLDSPTNIRILHEKIWSLVKKDEYYKYLDGFEKSTELVEGDCPNDGGDEDKKENNIKPLPKKMLSLFASLGQYLYRKLRQFFFNLFPYYIDRDGIEKTTELVGDKKEYNIKPLPTNPKKILPLLASIENDCPNLDLECKMENLKYHQGKTTTISDFKSFCLYDNVKGNVFDKNRFKQKHFTRESADDSADECDEEWDSDDLSDDDQENKRKEAEMEFRKLILPFMGSTILQDENIFALDTINGEDDDNRDDFGTAILDYKTLIKAFDYELGITVNRY